MLRRMSETRRVVWLFPEPVRTAQTETTGLLDLSWVLFFPITRKSAPGGHDHRGFVHDVFMGHVAVAKTTWSTFTLDEFQKSLR
jgi:hypothetical protein